VRLEVTRRGADPREHVFATGPIRPVDAQQVAPAPGSREQEVRAAAGHENAARGFFGKSWFATLWRVLCVSFLHAIGTLIFFALVVVPWALWF